MSAGQSSAPERSGITVDLIERLRDHSPRVTVIGDLILDGWWRGHSDRMTREAPAPVVEITERTYTPGGAANTAANLGALGARVQLVGMAGDDENGDLLLSLLQERRIDVSGVVRARASTTMTKTRISGSDQLLVRFDDLPTDGYPEDALRELARNAVAATAESDAEIICDYSSGALAGLILDALVGRSARPKLTVVDAHDLRPWARLKPQLVTPNAAEALRLIDDERGTGDRVAFFADHAQSLRTLAGAESAVITLDRDGTVLACADGSLYRTYAHPAAEKHASGAGDTFAAALTVARSCGLSLSQSVDLAQTAADIVVQRPTTSVCSTSDLIDRLGQNADRTVDASELEAIVAEHRTAGRRIVFTNGCFDVLHRGHTSYLRQAKQLGDVLIVALNGDDSVRRLKGQGRPVNPASDRANVLAALACVDYVTVFETDTPIPLIDRLRPDIYTKGGDYTPEMLEETAVVRAYGGQVTILGYVPAQSTTAVVERIRSSAVDDSRLVDPR
jgi:rfaE bifunctional protein kinase chain/domain/rfaE bifunctional protein nucleotidyltransferase chain/domain